MALLFYYQLAYSYELSKDSNKVFQIFFNLKFNLIIVKFA